MKANLDSSRKTAIIVGVLFIIGTVVGMASAVISGPVLSAPDYLTKIAANATPITLGALFVLIMGLTLALIPVVIFPVLKKHNEVLALGYLVFRGALENLTGLVIVISWLLLVPLSQEFGLAGTSNAPDVQALGNLLLKAAEIGSAMTAIVFPLGAMMLYVVFYQSKLIPRWLSVWGLIGVTLYLFGMGLAGMFGLTNSISTFQWVFFLPTLLQEMVMAVWLIIKGFNTSALSSEPVKAGKAFA